MGIKEKQPKKNQEHTWQKILWAKKIREFNLTKREGGRKRIYLEVRTCCH